MEKCYCKYCGRQANDVANLVKSSCPNHPNGFSKGNHALYQGTEKPQYTCQYCGKKVNSIMNLTQSSCIRRTNKLHCEPAL